MTLDSTRVRVAVSGEILVGLTTATPPATAAAVTTGYVGLGYISEDGVKQKADRSTEDIVAWQNGATVRVVTKDAKVTYQFTLIETNAATIGFVFGTSVVQTATEGTYNADPAATGGRKAYILDVIDGTNLKRTTFEGELTELGEITYAGGEPIGYDCTVTAYTVPVVHDVALKTP